MRYITQMCPHPDYKLQIYDTREDEVVGCYQNVALAEKRKDEMNKKEREKWIRAWK